MKVRSELISSDRYTYTRPHTAVVRLPFDRLSCIRIHLANVYTCSSAEITLSPDWHTYTPWYTYATWHTYTPSYTYATWYTYTPSYTYTLLLFRVLSLHTYATSHTYTSCVLISTVSIYVCTLAYVYTLVYVYSSCFDGRLRCHVSQRFDADECID